MCYILLIFNLDLSVTTSTADCTFVIQEVIVFYNDQNTNVSCSIGCV